VVSDLCEVDECKEPEGGCLIELAFSVYNGLLRFRCSTGFGFRVQGLIWFNLG